MPSRIGFAQTAALVFDSQFFSDIYPSDIHAIEAPSSRAITAFGEGLYLDKA